ncbi:cyclic nucleotide-binding domain-containing protein [uncultured Maribacter sp.]|uniref:Crp/Fnr family transcriptional regulator n=1 Tax=uncultured Maribacter sp. TaxID=431308 RepID=UPI00260DBB79|nr:cyclic nucleotide-binding domain-containing protein [uncultured Maribacter sp.]
MKKFLSNIYTVDEDVLEEYISHWSEYAAPKKTILTESGKTERYVYFVKEGIQKSYYLNEGKQHIMFFAYNPSFSGVVESFLTQTPSKYYLETITDSKLLRLSYEKHKLLIQEHREIETLFRKVTEYFLLGIIERHHQLMAFNAETRFKKFIKRSPHLLHRIPQKDIASYLRIDATNFSKLINTIKF